MEVNATAKKKRPKRRKSDVAALMAGTDLNEKTILSRFQVAFLFGVSTATLDNWTKKNRNPDFPKPFYIGCRPYWPAADLDRFISEKAQQANQREAV